MATSTEETTNVVITEQDIKAAKTLVALSRGKRYLSREEDEDVTRDDDDVQQECKASKNSSNKKCKGEKEVDNSEETMMIIKAWNLTEPNPVEKLPNSVSVLLDQISKPIKKQLTVSDVKEDLRRLMLAKDQVTTKMRPLLTESEVQRLTEGLNVTVYGPNNVVKNMKFKMWNKTTPVLTTGWKGFVDACDLKEHCDFLRIWMFRHRETRELCFVIDKTKYSTITKPLGKEISDQFN